MFCSSFVVLAIVGQLFRLSSLFESVTGTSKQWTNPFSNQRNQALFVNLPCRLPNIWEFIDFNVFYENNPAESHMKYTYGVSTSF